VVLEVVRVQKNSDSSGGDGQARVHHHPNKTLVNTIPTTTQVERLRVESTVLWSRARVSGLSVGSR
jgi:hypothetical protein